MTKKKFAEEMELAATLSEHDPEAGHAEMDKLMCAVLSDLGYGKGVDIFVRTEKWYA